jgi:hypothetical protein
MKSYTIFLFLALILFIPTQPVAASQTNASFASSNSGISNVQVTTPFTGVAVDPNSGGCLSNVVLSGGAESMITIDPNDPNHLIGATHFVSKWTDVSFTGSVGVMVSHDGGTTWNEHLITGFDCAQAGFNHVLRTYDPTVAIDGKGNLYAGILPDTGSDLPIYVSKSTDDGQTWTTANGGKPVFTPSSTKGSADKEWIIVDNSPSSPYHGTIYIVWGAFFNGYNNLGEILLSKSVDQGATFSAPVRASPPHTNNIGYFWPIPAIASDGTLYVNFASTPISLNDVNYGIYTEYVVKSTDGGNAFAEPVSIATTVYRSGYDNTKFRAGILQSFAVNPSNGHLYLALEYLQKYRLERVEGSQIYSYLWAKKTDIGLSESSDGGQTWSKPILVNDNPPDQNETAFQPVVAVSPSGLVAVSFYDRRLSCPNQPWVRPQDVGKDNLCVDTAIQFYTDSGSLAPVGDNIRVTKYSWDPDNPGQNWSAAGYALPWFLGDYFGLALTDTVAYPFFTAAYDLGQNPQADFRIFLAKVNTPINLAQTTTSTTSSSMSTQSQVTSSSMPTETMSSQTSVTPPSFSLGNMTVVVVAVVIAVIVVAAALVFLMMRRKKTSQ